MSDLPPIGAMILCAPYEHPQAAHTARGIVKRYLPNGGLWVRLDQGDVSRWPGEYDARPLRLVCGEREMCEGCEKHNLIRRTLFHAQGYDDQPPFYRDERNKHSDELDGAA